MRRVGASRALTLVVLQEAQPPSSRAVCCSPCVCSVYHAWRGVRRYRLRRTVPTLPAPALGLAALALSAVALWWPR